MRTRVLSPSYLALVLVLGTCTCIRTSIAVGDVCTMNQHCLNGGKCVPADDSIDHRHCVCQDGFSGLRCSSFCPLECQNGGYCTTKPRGGALGDQEQKPTDYMCKCHGYFMGELCEIAYLNCGGQTKCFNGGACTLNNDGKHLCQCPIGYAGNSCEIVLPPDDSDEMGMEMDIVESELATVGKRYGSLVVSIVVFVLLGGFMLHRHRRIGCQFRDYHENREDFVLKQEMRRINLKETGSVRNWSVTSTLYNNRGVELDLI